MSLSYDINALSLQHSPPSNIWERSFDHEPSSLVFEHSHSPTSRISDQGYGFPPSSGTVGRTDDLIFPNTSLVQSTDNLKQSYRTGRGFCLEAPTTQYEKTLAAADWAASRSSGSVQLPQAYTLSNLGLGLSFGNNDLPDIAGVSERPHAADPPCYFSTAAIENCLPLPTSRPVRDFKSSSTVSTLEKGRRPRTRTSITGPLDLFDDSRAQLGLGLAHSYFLRLCLDGHGSNFVGMKLETAPGTEKGRIFREIEPHIIQLMEDAYGHTVILKALDYGTMRQKARLVRKIKGSMVRLSLHTYGSRVMRKAMGYLLVSQQVELMRELEPEILNLLCDREGNSVVRKIIEFVPETHREFILKSLRGRVINTATHAYGRYIIQKLLDISSDEEKAFILAEL